MSNLEHQYFVKVLKEILVIFGPSSMEGEVIDYVEKELRGCGKDIVIEKDPKIGIWAMIPAKTKARQSLIFDAHLDTVESFYKTPEFFVEVINEKPVLQVCATGIDDRVFCALMCVMARFVRFDHTSYVLLFSKEEEIGKYGAFHFSTKIDVEKRHPNVITKVKKIICLDVCDGVLSYDEKKKEEWAVIGKGSIPFSQDFSIGRERGENDVSPTNGDVMNGIYKHVKKVKWGIPMVHMHKIFSLASVTDAIDLYENIKKVVEPKILEEDFEVLEYDKTDEKEVYDTRMQLHHDSSLGIRIHRKERNLMILEAARRMEQSLGIKISLFSRHDKQTEI